MRTGSKKAPVVGRKDLRSGFNHQDQNGVLTHFNRYDRPLIDLTEVHLVFILTGRGKRLEEEGLERLFSIYTDSRISRSLQWT